MATQPTNMPVPSESPRDLKFNAGKIDEFVTSLINTYIDRFGNKHYTIEGLRQLAQQAIAEFGWIPIGTFQAGTTLTLPNQILKDTTDGEYYRWDNTYPKVVASGSTPSSSGGVGVGAWISVGDAALRSLLASTQGASNVGTSNGETVQQYLDSVSSARYSERNRKYLAFANKKLMAGEAVKIICQGDSITAGYDITSSDKVPPTNGDHNTHAPITYPDALQQFLAESAAGVITVINQGISGQTAKMGYNYWTANPGGDVVHLMYGLNDAGGVSGATYDEFIDYMGRMIRRYIDWGFGVVVHTCTAQSYDAGNYATPRFSAGVESLAKVYGCPVFDSESVLQYAEFDGVYSDAVHFNKQGYYKYGHAVSSFILSGSWARRVKPVTGTYLQQIGRYSNTIGFYQKNTTPRTSNGSYLYTRGVCSFSPGAASVATFHFYSDCDFMEVSLIGSLDGLSATIARIANEMLPEYANRGELSRNKFTLKSAVTRGIREGADFLIQPGRSQGAGRMSHLGFAIGKGWKTIRVYSDGSVASDRYLSGLMLKPSRFKDAATSTNIIGNSGEMDVHICQFPYGTASSSSNVVPAAVALTTVSLPIPDGLYNWMFLASNAYDTLPFYVDILVRGSADNTTNPNGFARYIMYRQSGSPTLAITKAYGDNVITPQSAVIQKAPGGTSTSAALSFTDGIPSTADGETGRILLTFPTRAAAYYTIMAYSSSRAQSQGTFFS